MRKRWGFLVKSDFWLSTGGFSIDGAGQVGSLGNMQWVANFFNMEVIGVFIWRGDSPWVVLYETDEILLVRSWFWLSTGGFSSGGTGRLGSLGNRDVIVNFFNMEGIGVFIRRGNSPWGVLYETDEVLLVRSFFDLVPVDLVVAAQAK